MAASMRVTVRLFARLRDVVGETELVREIPPDATVADVWQALAVEWPAVAAYGASLSCAVNADYARMTARVEDGDEVAFLPPVSGG
ncbi:MAG: MoaD family protein [Luteitalea sp.]|nr:MoaD family protein [Luteitalea sp.]